MTLVEVICTDIYPKLENHDGTDCLIFHGSITSLKTKNFKIEVYSKDHNKLLNLINYVGNVGQIILLQNPDVKSEPKSPLEPGLMRVIQKFDGDIVVKKPGNHLSIRRFSNSIQKILNTVLPTISDPYLRYLAKWPFINGHTLSSLTHIGASQETEYHHCRPGGIIDHVEEMVVYQSAIQSEMNLNEECAGVVSIWHDMGKTCVTDAKNPTQTIADYKQANDHDRYTLWLHGNAHNEYPHDIEIETSAELRSLTSALGNIHNPRIYNTVLNNVREYDRQSAKFDQQSKSSENGFQKISEKERN
tara:strand:- start:193 stop:1101 length:909 start_codon:yes stop_codon:yes gene_type:complete